jgi:hypothetical protein
MVSRSVAISRAVQQLVSLPGFSSLRTIKKQRPLHELTERELIQRESTIGRELFGPIKKGHRREFFNTDPHIWIWHEEWPDEDGLQQLTTKYEVREDGVWKVQPGPRYHRLEGEELRNFRQAVSVYFERVMREVYGRNPQTGKKLL